MDDGISSYSLWWIIIHSDWYRYHGDRAYLAEQRPYLTALLRQLFEKIGPDGRERLDGTRFLDWPSSGDAREHGGGSPVADDPGPRRRGRAVRGAGRHRVGR